MKWRQILDLFLRDVEPNPRVDRGDGTDRDSHLPAAPQVTLLKQDVGHLMVGRIDYEPLDLPDLAVYGVHALMALHLGLPQRDGVLDHQRRAFAQAHSDAHAGNGATHAHAADVAVTLNRLGLAVAAAVPAVHQFGLLSRLEPAELLQRAPQPDFPHRRLGQI